MLPQNYFPIGFQEITEKHITCTLVMEFCLITDPPRRGETFVTRKNYIRIC